jgi:hypothetical protein
LGYFQFEGYDIREFDQAYVRMMDGNKDIVAYADYEMA